MNPSSFQRYINGISTVFRRFYSEELPTWRTSDERLEPPLPHGGRNEGWDLSSFGVFSMSDDRFEVAKPYMVIKRRKGCSTAHTIEKEKTRKQINDDMNRWEPCAEREPKSSLLRPSRSKVTTIGSNKSRQEEGLINLERRIAKSRMTITQT